MKISLANLEKLMCVCTKKEIDFIIYIGQFQNEKGVIKGINYKDVLENINICKSTFYKLLYSLEDKNIIKINYINEYLYWEVEFLDNNFVDKNDYKKGYLKLNFAVLHCDEFKNMTKSEKVIVLNLLKICDFKRNVIKITINKIIDWTNKSLRSVKKFIETLTNIFDIKKDDNLLSINCHRGFDIRSKIEADIYNSHIIDYT